MARLAGARAFALGALLGVAALAGGAAASCVPGATRAGGSDGGSHDGTVPDAHADGAPSHDAAADSASDTGGVPSPVPEILIGTTGIQTETGNAQQQHLIFAKNSGRWWLFYIDADGLSVKTQSSLDFVTWTAGGVLTPLPLHLGGDGRNFSVAYKDFGGIDVVHLATSLHDEPKRVVYDTRATIAGGVITFGAPVFVHDIDDVASLPPDAGPQGPQGGSYCDPDGTGVAIGGDGHVYVATSWVSVWDCCSCDSNFATSTSLDTGASWAGGFASPLQHFTVPGSTHGRQVIGMSTGVALGGWETADNEPNAASNVSWASNNGGTWPGDGTYPVFSTPPFGGEWPNDWSMCRIDDDHIHVVRRRLELLPDGGGGDSAVFDHYFFSGSSWTFLGSLANDIGLAGMGVTLLTNGTSLLAAAIGADANQSVRYATYDGTSWSGWSTLAGTTAVRQYISGSGCGDPAHPALIWTEGAVAPYRVFGAAVSALMP